MTTLNQKQVDLLKNIDDRLQQLINSNGGPNSSGSNVNSKCFIAFKKYISDLQKLPYGKDAENWQTTLIKLSEVVTEME